MLATQSDRWVVEEFNRLRFLTAVTNARAEEGEYLAPRPVGERVEQTHIICVVEGYPPLLTVQEHPEPLRGRTEVQPGPGLRAGGVLVPITQPQRPVAAFGAQLDPSAPAYGLRGHAQVPLGFGAHFYLPVVSACLEALGGQNVDTLEETLVVVRMWDHDVTLNCHGFVTGDLDAWVRCVNIKR